MFKRFLLTLAVAILVAGCGVIAPQDKIDFAKHFVSLFNSGNFGEIHSDLDPHFDWQKFEPIAHRMVSLIPKGRLLGETESWNTSFMATTAAGASTRTIVVISYHYSGPMDLRATVGVRQLGHRFVITDVYFTQFLNSRIKANALSLNMVALGVAAIIVLLIVVALIQLLRSKGIRFRFLWALFIIFGLGRFMLDWTTGQYLITLFAFQLFGVGFLQASPYDSWVLILSFPVGAIMFLARRRTLLENAGYAPGKETKTQSNSGRPRDMRDR